MIRKPRWGNCLLASLLEFARHPLTTRIYRVKDEKGRSHFYWKNREGVFSFGPLKKLPESRIAQYWYRGVVKQGIAFMPSESAASVLEDIAKARRQLEAQTAAGTR